MVLAISKRALGIIRALPILILNGTIAAATEINTKIPPVINNT